MKIWPTKIEGVHGDLPMKDGDFPWRFRNFPGHGATRKMVDLSIVMLVITRG